MIEMIETGMGDAKEINRRSLPKNVRQVGDPGQSGKIYIEDFVITYLNKLAKPEQAYVRGAVLFGDVCITEEGPAVFISGALEAENLEFNVNEICFDEETCESLRERAKRYFPGQIIVGWFLSRMGFSVHMDQNIETAHLKYFPGDYKVLYMIDSLEKEDAIYMSGNRCVKKQKGYYIYYEKNKGMQEYMIDAEGGEKSGTEKEERAGEMRRDKKVVSNYRKRAQYEKDRKKQDMRIQVLRTASSLLTIIMGILIVGKLSGRFPGKDWGSYVVETFQTVKEGVMDEKHVPVIEETKNADQQIVIIEENMDSSTKEQMQEVSAVQKPLYYTVQKGDTLAAISRKMYLTDKYTAQIAKANGLTNADEIYPGQEILIPLIE